MSLKLFNPSGGLQYHFRAIWNSKKWQPFKEFVEAWLLDWKKNLDQANVSTLVLIGPNAGYTLPQSFLSQFPIVVVVEPDPAAYALFEARFLLSSKWVRQDYFSLKSKNPDPNNLKTLFDAFPGAAFLFCNMLGQIPVLLRENKSESDVDLYMTQLGQVLESQRGKQHIASYHDRYSRNLKKPNEMIDHLTGKLFVNVTDKKEFPWLLTAKIEHQIEFVRFPHIKL